MPRILSTHMAATRSVVHVNTFSSENFGNTYYKYIQYTPKCIKCPFFLGKDQLGAWLTKRCSRAVVNCSADVDVDFAVNANSAAVFMVICLLWRFAAAQSGKRIARVCYAYRGLKKNTEEVNPRSETKLKSENVVNYKKLLRYFVDFLRVCCQVLNETVNIKLIACQTSRLACLPCYQLYNTIIPVRPATTYIN